MILYVLKFVLTFIRSSRLSTSHLFDTDYTAIVMSTFLLRYWELYNIKYIIKIRNARLILCMRNLSVQIQRKNFWTSRTNVGAHLVSSVQQGTFTERKQRNETRFSNIKWWSECPTISTLKYLVQFQANSTRSKILLHVNDLLEFRSLPSL